MIVYLFGNRLHAVVIPIALAVFRHPTVCTGAILVISRTDSRVPDDVLRGRISDGYHRSVPAGDAASVHIGRDNTTRATPSGGQAG